MAMIDTCRWVAKRYGSSRRRPDAFSPLRQQRQAPSAGKGLFANEHHRCARAWPKKNKDNGRVTYRDVVATKDNCNPPQPTLEGLASWKPVKGQAKLWPQGNALQ
ncbi:hypothetical protein [Comamonas terrigena]|uniref:hypothetical protein n=1 Tax=Comamonas terrigena TaxID=32013 RepID=UPI001D0EA0D5|nr:hypothetical protein [Comamonas terrigena]